MKEGPTADSSLGLSVTRPPEACLGLYLDTQWPAFPPPRSLRSASERTPSRFGDRPGRVRWAGREQDCFSRGLCCADTPRPAQAALASLTLARRPQLLVRGAGGRPAGLRACLTGSGGGRRPGPWEAGICTRVGRTPLWAGTP